MAAPVLVDSLSEPSITGDGFTAAPIDFTGVDFIAVGVGQDGTFGTVTDSEFNDYVEEAGPTTPFDAQTGAIWYVEDPAVSASHEISISGTSNSPALIITGWAGAELVAPVDQVSAGDSNGFSETIQPGSVTPTTDDQLVLTVVGGQADNTPGFASIDGGFTIEGQIEFAFFGIHIAVALASLAQTTAAAANPTWTCAGGIQLSAKSITVKSAGGGGGITGSGAITLDSISVAGTGTRTSNGSGALALSPIEIAGIGERTITGSGALDLLPILVAGTGTVGAEETGSGAIVLPSITVAGTGVRGASGTGSITLPGIEVAGTGKRQANGVGAITLPALQVAGAGVRGVNGVGAIVLPTLEVAGAGAASSGIIGNGALTLNPITVNGAGTRISVGTGATILPAIQVDGNGTVQSPVIGSANIVLPAIQVAGIGERTITGSGAIVLPSITVLGYEDPPVPPDIYTYIDGTAFDSQGRMLTVPLGVSTPLPVGVRFIEGLAHDSQGRRYVTTWAASPKYIQGLAVRVDGVQIISPDGLAERAISGIPITFRGEVPADEFVPIRAVEGRGISSANRLSVSDKS